MIRVGIGGWVFPAWRGTFYPAGLRHADELPHASRHLTAIEINATFHRTQSAASFATWRDATPDGFVFTAKAPRAASYRSDPEAAAPSVTRFLDSGLLGLGDRLGPLLWQFSPRTAFDPGRVGAFLALLPAQHGGVALRHAIEATHPSFADPGFAALLRARNVAWAMVDAEGAPLAPEPTADFLYARLKRSRLDEPVGYPPRSLRDWAKRLREWDTTLLGNSHAFFIGGDKVRAPAAATALLRLLSDET